MTALLQEAFEKASTLPADVQEQLAKELLAEIAAFHRDVPAPSGLPPLPVFSSGGARVDVSNRDELYDVMERDECS
jgi:hypothetical protein